jgi:cytochrome b6-f complex iron-sulfur subunit
VNDDPEQLDKHVEDLLQDRKPERTPLADADALRARQIAAMLHAAKPGAGLPSREFLERMQAEIPKWVEESSPLLQPKARLSRRDMLLTGAAGLAAGVAVTLGISKLAQSPEPTAKWQALVGQSGIWTPVKAVSELPEGTPIAFRSGAIEGFLIRQGQTVKGLSAICTHMGCILNYSKFRNQFECPCHGATFGTDGKPGQYREPLAPLPSLQVRISSGQVEVYTV